MMPAIAVISILLILTVLLDAFETVVLPRRVTRRFRLARIFYHATWVPGAALAGRISSSRRRETFLSFYGPLSLILLLSVWALGLITGFAMLHWSLGSPLNAVDGSNGFGTYVLVMVGVDGASRRQAQLTFAMARHAVVDLAQVFNTPPREPFPDRLPSEELNRLRAVLAAADVKLADGAAADQRLSELRRMYEPFVSPLADFLFIPLPSWVPADESFDNWQTSRWGRISGLAQSARLPSREEEEHF